MSNEKPTKEELEQKAKKLSEIEKDLIEKSTDKILSFLKKRMLIIHLSRMN